MKRFIGLVVGAALLLSSAPPVAAGSRARARWEGAAIALGTIGLIAVLSDVAQAQPVAVSVGGWYPAYPDPWYCPPPPPPPPPPHPPQPFVPEPPRMRVWVPGHWEEVEVWVPQVWVTPGWSRPVCRDDHDRHRGYGHRRHRGHDDCGSGSYLARETRGHFERRKVWKEGYYR